MGTLLQKSQYVHGRILASAYDDLVFAKYFQIFFIYLVCILNFEIWPISGDQISLGDT